MRLQAWIVEKKLNLDEAARLFGVTPAAVHKWLTGNVPRAEKMTLIHQVTKGQVAPNDFYNLPKVKRPRGKLLSARGRRSKTSVKLNAHPAATSE